MSSAAAKRLDRSLKSHCEHLRVFAGLDRDGSELPATAENLAAARTAAAQFAALQTKVLKLAKKGGAVDRVIRLVHPAMTGHLSQEQARFFIEECDPILTRAHDKFLASRGSLANAHEESLCELFVHLKSHEDFYFRQFFLSDFTNPWMDRCVGMLGTYATLLRQRGEFHACFEVLKIDSRILARLTDVVTAGTGGTQHTSAVARQMEVDNLKGLTYKFLLIKTNLRTDLSLPVPRGMTAHQELAEELRVMMLYEIETDAAAQGVEQALTVLELAGYPPTVQGLAKATDRELWEANESAQQLQRKMMAKQLQQHKKMPHGATTRPMQGRVAHHVCAGCGRAEPYLNSFPRCGGCKAVFYHSPECQKSHWKTGGHKQACKALGEQRKRKEAEHAARAAAATTTAAAMSAEWGAALAAGYDESQEEEEAEEVVEEEEEEEALPAGATVQLHGLTSAQALNGLLGTVIAPPGGQKKTQPSGRVAVRMADGQIRAVKHENLRLVTK
jgi:hypothetical protein